MNIDSHTLNLTAPKVVEAYGANGDRLNFNDVYGASHISVQVPHYVGMDRGHTIKVRWFTGRHTFETATLTVGTPAIQTFQITRLEFIDPIGSQVAVNYSVRTAIGLPLIFSAALTLTMDPQSFDLAEPRLSPDRRTVTVKFLNMTPGYTVRVRWHGVVIRDTETKPIVGESSVTFAIPAGWVTENQGKGVLINYSLHKSGAGENLMFSRVLRASL